MSIRKPSDDPWIAVNLSALWPGLGQLYGGAWIKGVGLVLVTPILIGYGGWSLFAAEGNTLTGLMTIAVLAMVFITNLFDAYNTIRPLPRGTFSTIYQPVRNRWYAVFLSQILPGFGHLYCQQALVGGLFLGLITLIGYWANFYPMLLPLPPLIWAIACYHLYRTTKTLRPQRAPHHHIPQQPSSRPHPTPSAAHRRTRTTRPTATQKRSAAQDWVIVAIMGGLIAIRLSIGSIPVWVSQSVLQCIVPSASMEPTLQVGDRLFVRYPVPYQPQQGDLVVFRTPVNAIALLNNDPDTLFVKRVIALPQQTVAIMDGSVLVDDSPLAEPYIASAPDYQLGPITVPNDSYFVLGDNRNESADSHIWGFLPADDIVGRAYKIYWPPQRIQALP